VRSLACPSTNVPENPDLPVLPPNRRRLPVRRGLRKNAPSLPETPVPAALRRGGPEATARRLRHWTVLKSGPVPAVRPSHHRHAPPGLPVPGVLMTGGRAAPVRRLRRPGGPEKGSGTRLRASPWRYGLPEPHRHRRPPGMAVFPAGPGVAARRRLRGQKEGRGTTQPPIRLRHFPPARPFRPNQPPSAPRRDRVPRAGAPWARSGRATSSTPSGRTAGRS
jgi:hypothetical protein